MPNNEDIKAGLIGIVFSGDKEVAGSAAGIQTYKGIR
jgi:hypothetical protein